MKAKTKGGRKKDDSADANQAFSTRVRTSVLQSLKALLERTRVPITDATTEALRRYVDQEMKAVKK